MRWTILAASVLSLAACGGGTGKSGVASVNGHPNPAVIAAKFGCTGYTTQTGQIELFAATEGTCSFQGSDESILTFASSSSLSKWQKAAMDIAGRTGTDVMGDRFVVEANNADEATTIASKVGGHTE